MAESDLFRWQALFQRVGEPFFLLDRQRRILFVNQEWEKLTGLKRAEVRGRRCRRRRQPEAGWQTVAHSLAPPGDVLDGNPARVRRAAGAGRGWWDVEFFPLMGDATVLTILGKVRALSTETQTDTAPVPEKLLTLRERLADRYCVDAPFGELPALQRVADQVRLARQTRSAVLLVGAAGTGKHWTARAIHHRSVARERGFAAVDGARLPVPVLAALLFGPGGLTRPGGIGTLYLREPAALPREVQEQLVSLLADPAPDRPRVIAGTSTDPEADIRAGRLLEELHARLATLVIALPTLRERLTDLPVLVARMLERTAARADKPHAVAGLTPEAWDAFRAYRWPGNLRELYSVLSTASARAGAERIDAAHLPAHLRQAVQLGQVADRPSERVLPLDTLLEQVERRLIQWALRAAGGNKSRAAELLSVWRPRLLRRMEALGIKES
jgi:DNA-binding NtrC family response regulator